MGRAEEKSGWGGGSLSLWVGFVLVVLAGEALGVVLHPDGEPGAGWVDRPGDAVVGRWGGNASCVVVSPNWVVTVRHAGGGVGTSVAIEGQTYTVAEVVNEPAGDGASADLRLCRLERVGGGPVNLDEWAQLYGGSYISEPNVVIGGYGMARGAAHSDEYGSRYAWLSGSGGVLRWGTNTMDDWISQESVLSYVTDSVRMDFDAAGAGTEYEAAVAGQDSGGGWFAYEDGVWKVAALSAYVEYGDYASRYEPPEWNYAVWLGSYADWIEATVVEPQCQAAGDVTGDCVVDMEDLAVLAGAWLGSDCGEGNGWCEGADVWRDGRVDLRDAAVVLGDWAKCGWEPAWGCEP